MWLAPRHDGDDPDSGVPWPPQPGINGVRYRRAERLPVLHVDGSKGVHARGGRPEDARSSRRADFVAAIDNADDFCIDENAGFAYVTRHRANTVDRVPLEPRHGSEVRHIAGDPFDEILVGPVQRCLAPRPDDRGRVTYVTTDGGTTAPPDGIVRNAAVLRRNWNRLMARRRLRSEASCLQKWRLRFRKRLQNLTFHRRNTHDPRLRRCSGGTPSRAAARGTKR